MTTGQRIRDARKAAGLTQKELAQRLGLSFQSVAQWENDLRNPKIETLQKIAEALEISPEKLFGSREERILCIQKTLDDVQRDIDEMEKRQTRLLIDAYKKLNFEGREIAIGCVEGLAQLPQYQRQTEAEAPETPPGSADDKEPEEK